MTRALSVKEFWLLSAAGFASLFGLWSAVAVTGAVPAQFLPAPWAVVERIVELTQKPFVGFTIQEHLWSSVLRYLLGFGLAAAVGVPLGLLMGWFRWLDSIVSPLFEGIRFIAPIAWVPFAALWFGTGIGGPTLIIFICPPISKGTCLTMSPIIHCVIGQNATSAMPPACTGANAAASRRHSRTSGPASRRSAAAA